jgi:two-component system chemotaxis response regulator CheB
MTAPIRVLVVDDSAFVRKVLREVLQNAGFDVVGIAHDGLEALEKISELKPDVITLDLVMPNLDGIGVLHALRGGSGPRVVVVSFSDDQSELGVEALQSGAITLVHKPPSLATEQLYELSGELTRAVKEAALARYLPPRVGSSRLPPIAHKARHCELVVIGTSTGGPQALSRLLPEIARDFPVPIAIALHIPAGYTEELAKRLDRSSQIDVVEATPGLELRPGLAVLARGGSHLKLEQTLSRLAVQLDDEPRNEPHHPSVDVLFESAAARLRAAVLGVVLTGMGSDGLRGARAIHAVGGRIITEAESSCVVYGMPAMVKEAGLACDEVPLEEMAHAIARHI